MFTQGLPQMNLDGQTCSPRLLWKKRVEGANAPVPTVNTHTDPTTFRGVTVSKLWAAKDKGYLKLLTGHERERRQKGIERRQASPASTRKRRVKQKEKRPKIYLRAL